MNRADVYCALRWIGLVATLVVALTMAGSFVSYERVVADGHPWLPRKVCDGCRLCGMTRSFCAMSEGRFQTAYAHNAGGPVLWVGGWVWLAVTAVTCGRRRLRNQLRNGGLWQRNRAGGVW